MGMYGIDISEHNGDIDLSEYKDQFVIIRAGWGWSAEQKDKKFDRNVRECMKLKIPFGVYWYSYAIDKDTAKQEAEAFLEVIEPYRNDISMGVWSDQEDADGWRQKNGLVIDRIHISEITSLICSMIRKKGYHTGIYCSYSWLKYFSRECDVYDRWVAHWGTNDGTLQKDMSMYGSIHQFTSTPLDRDYSHKDPAHFQNRKSFFSGHPGR